MDTYELDLLLDDVERESNQNIRREMISFDDEGMEHIQMDVDEMVKNLDSVDDWYLE